MDKPYYGKRQCIVEKMDKTYYGKRQCIANKLGIDRTAVDTDEIRYTKRSDGKEILFYKGVYIGIYDNEQGKLVKAGYVEKEKRQRILF